VLNQIVFYGDFPLADFPGTLVIIVNYKAARLTLEAVRSVFDSSSLGPVRVAVVDNSEDNKESEILEANLGSKIELYVSPKNLGFGRACQYAYDKCPGEEDVLLLNPDARLLPGSLARLQKTLFSWNKSAAVAPRVYWGGDMPFQLPPSCPPALFMWQPIFEKWSRNASKIVSSWWRYHSIRIWRSTGPLKVPNLSGGVVLLKRKAVQEAGGLFDPRFFLYFEDTDLFIRLKKAKYVLMVEPRAEAVHNYDQCAQYMWEEKRALMAKSQKLFMHKYCNGWKGGVIELLSNKQRPAYGDQLLNGIPEFTAPFHLRVPPRWQKPGWLFEWSPNLNFVPSMGFFGSGPAMKFTRQSWSMQTPGRYFGRLGRAKGFGRDARVVSWVVSELPAPEKKDNAKDGRNWTR
jgi:GT2 family glycosyltransferase